MSLFDWFADRRKGQSIGKIIQEPDDGDGVLSKFPQIGLVVYLNDLKANTNFLNLQNQLVSLENQIADRREFYNAASTNFNKAIQMIPSNIVAGIKGCVRRELWSVEGVARENVQISF